MQNPESDWILGIDLGTTNSLAGLLRGGEVEILSGGLGGALMPSVVAVLPDGSTRVGEEAKDLAFDHPERVLQSVKRLIGRSLSEVRIEAEHLPYRIVEGSLGQARIRVPLDGKDGRPPFRDFSPEEISALILKEVHHRALLALGFEGGEGLQRVVVTVPAYFDDAQRQSTRKAAELAGLEVVRLVNEPTAASLAYGLGSRTGGNILVYDLGGGTFDVSILRITDGVFRVLSTHGDTQLGGDDFDRAILRKILEMILEETGVGAGNDPRILSTLRRSAEGLKIRLSEAEHAELMVEVGDRTLSFTLTRKEFETLIEKPLARTMMSVKAALTDARLGPSDLDEVVLVGGSTRIPRVRGMLEDFFSKAPRMGIDPDLAVALGAASQAAVLSGAAKDLLLLDVIPLSLGIETLGGAFSKLILRNSTVPCAKTEEYTTHVDDQTGIELYIYQGERELVKDCRRIGHLVLSGIPPMRAGLPRVAVTFTVDADATLRVTARELRSGQTASAEIQPTLGLDEGEVRRIVEESIDKAEEDFREREVLELKSRAEAVVKGTEVVLRKGGSEGLAPEQAYAVRKALSRVKKLLPGEDLSALQAALDQLSSLTMQLADDMIGASVRKALES